MIELHRTDGTPDSTDVDIQVFCQTTTLVQHERIMSTTTSRLFKNNILSLSQTSKLLHVFSRILSHSARQTTCPFLPALTVIATALMKPLLFVFLICLPTVIRAYPFVSTNTSSLCDPHGRQCSRTLPQQNRHLYVNSINTDLT
jgi:hypothetical protein